MLTLKGFISEATMDKTQLLKRDNINVLKTAIENGTPLETSKGKVALKWINDSDRLSFEGGDLDTAFYSNRRFKKVFITPDGDELGLNNVTKTSEFGGGRGSGGGAENTDITECLQCIYCSEIFNGTNPEDINFKALKSSDFEIDTDMSKIEAAADEGWVESSILIAEKMKSNLRGKFTFHKGSTLVTSIESKFKALNKVEKAFKNVNKWNPADIYAVKKGFVPNFSQFETLGEFNNYFKEMYDAQNLVGISLKKASGSVTVVENNITGFIRRPVTFAGYQLYKRTFFGSKDIYITMRGAGQMQLRTFGNYSFQGEIKGKSAAAGKIGGGVILAILGKVKGVTTTKTNSQIKALARKPTPQFMQEFYELYLTLEEKRKQMDKDEFMAQLAKMDADFIFSKYWAMFVTSNLDTDVTDAIAGYASSQSDLSGPHAVYK